MGGWGGEWGEGKVGESGVRGWGGEWGEGKVREFGVVDFSILMPVLSYYYYCYYYYY